MGVQLLVILVVCCSTVAGTGDAAPEFRFTKDGLFLLATIDASITSNRTEAITLDGSATVNHNLSSLTNSSAKLVLNGKGNTSFELLFEMKGENVVWQNFKVMFGSLVETAEFVINKDLGDAKKSFRCHSKVSQSGDRSILTLSNLQLQPFAHAANFSEETVCKEDQPTPAPAPAPTPAPRKESDWELKTGDNYLCLEFAANIALSVQYKTKNASEKIAVISVPGNANIGSESTCGNNTDEQKLVLTFGNNQSLSFLFSKDVKYTQKNSSWTMYEVELRANLADEALFPESSLTGIVTYNNDVSANGTGALKFITGEKQYWSCTPTVSYPIGDRMNMSLTGAKIYAFAKNSTQDRTAHYCAQEDVTNDLVPIVVGAALAALVVIVLIAYLIGRFRAKRNTGYESV